MANITDRPWLVPGHMYQYDIGWLVDKLLSFETELNTAIDLKTIHYADPIQWDITMQYSPNTVVVDPKTGTAYMSKVAVPAGILLTNTDYWVVIFNYQRIYDKIMSGVAFNDKDNLDASKDILVNDLVWYGGDLYRATRAIPQGSKYIPGTNLTPTTIADCLATYYGRDRSAQVLNDTLNVSGDYTLNAGDINRTATHITDHATADYLVDADGNYTADVEGKYTATIAGNREINVAGDDSIHVNGVTSINRGGAVTEVLGASKNTHVVGDVEFQIDGATKGTIGGKVNINAKDTVYSADTIVFNTLKKQIDLDTIPQTCVNVKDFGAVGDAHYYDPATNAFFTDSSKSKRPTSDVNAINIAIAVALAKGIRNVYFPDGDYYVPDWSYTLDSSKLSFIGSGHACLCHEGNVNRALITITSTVDLDEYTYAREPLKNISLHSNKFTGGSDEGMDGVAGIEYGAKGNSDATLVSPHINLTNVTVQGFACGLRIGTAYKSTLINFNAIACNYGIFISSAGYAQAVPLNLFNAHIECCNHAVWCLAPRYNEINFFGGAFEYCRQFAASNADLSFFSTRFEGDLLSFMDVTTKKAINAFNITGACLHLHSCYILLLPNYVDNVKHWVTMTDKLSTYDLAFVSVSSNAVPGVRADDLEIATDQWESTSTYFINSGTTKNLSITNGHLLGSIASKTNVINPAGILDQTNGFFNHIDS